MAVAVPQALILACPRCRIIRRFVAIDGGTNFRCAGCEWQWTLAAIAPTGTSNGALAAGGTAISVASGGTSFTNGMQLLYDTGQLTEVLTVNGSATLTSIPVSAATRSHLTGATFGQLQTGQTYTGFGVDGVTIPNPSWGF